VGGDQRPGTLHMEDATNFTFNIIILLFWDVTDRYIQTYVLSDRYITYVAALIYNAINIKYNDSINLIFKARYFLTNSIKLDNYLNLHLV